MTISPGSIVRTTDDVEFTGDVRVNAGASFQIADPTDATKILQFDCSGITTGTTSTIVASTTAQSFTTSAAGLAKVGTTAGWVVAAADNIALVTLPASQTASTLVIPVTGLKVGWTITGFHLIGQIESAGGAVTLDADLRKMTAAAADVTDASIGAITQIAVAADTAITSTNSTKTLVTPEVIAATESFYCLLTGTTAGSTDIAIQGLTLIVTLT